MPCFHPVSAWQRSDGTVVFAERGDILRSLQLSCGGCIGCRVERSRKWAVRCMHEASLHPQNCFVTLTYDDEHCPKDGSLNVRDWQLFAKRLRKSGGFRFYMCGEYGSRNWRPHYHALLFGRDFDDKLYDRRGSQDDKIYRSALLDSVWGHGFASIGAVTFESAAYTAAYCVDKWTGPNSDDYYNRINCFGVRAVLKPPFNIMSRRPGIGAAWLEKFHRRTYAFDEVIVNGKSTGVPRYYDKLYKRMGSEYADRLSDLKAQREVDALLLRADNTPERLAVRKEVFLANYRNLRNV